MKMKCLDSDVGQRAESNQDPEWAKEQISLKELSKLIGCQ